jgi:predicted Zn-dependent peptidase
MSGNRRLASVNWLAFALAGAGVVAALLPISARQAAPRPSTAAASSPSPQVSDTLKLVTEFDVNGLKVLVKRREGSQTVAAALFLRGGARNITADNAGIETLMLDMATEASADFPRERLRRELARTGTVLNAGVNRDYSGLTLGSTRQYFDRAWEIFTDAALHPSFAADDFDRVKKQELIGLSDDEDTPDSPADSDVSDYAGHPYLNNPHGTMES